MQGLQMRLVDKPAQSLVITEPPVLPVYLHLVRTTCLPLIPRLLLRAAFTVAESTPSKGSQLEERLQVYKGMKGVRPVSGSSRIRSKARGLYFLQYSPGS